MPSPADFSPALLTPDRPPPAGLTPQARFAVYRNNVVAGLIEALGAAYPAVKALVGERFFKAMTAVYVRAEPPTSPVLIHYGAGFPAFLETFEPARRLPYLADVARLERAWLQAYHAAEAEPLPLQALARLPASTVASATLTLHPSSRLVASRFPVRSLWAANTGRGSHDAVDLDRAETALVVRPIDQVQVHLVDAGFAAFAASLLRAESLALAAEAALAATPEFDLAQAMHRLFALGIVTATTQSEARSPLP